MSTLITTPMPLNGDTLYEVVNGQRRELLPTGAFETSLAKIILVLLNSYGMQHALGEAYMEMLFLLDAERDLQRRQDVAFVSYKHWPRRRKVPPLAQLFGSDEEPQN